MTQELTALDMMILDIGYENLIGLNKAPEWQEPAHQVEIVFLEMPELEDIERILKVHPRGRWYLFSSTRYRWILDAIDGDQARRNAAANQIVEKLAAKRIHVSREPVISWMIFDVGYGDVLRRAYNNERTAETDDAINGAFQRLAEMGLAKRGVASVNLTRAGYDLAQERSTASRE